MQMKNKVKEQLNTLLVAGFILLLAFLIGWKYDYFYALNDDMMMKDILAGVFTGTPDGHNIQMLYPISFLISILYRITNKLPWYAIFLWVCHFGCFFLIAKRILCFTKTIYMKIIALAMEGIFIASFFLWEIVFMQYTVTSGLLAATAAFLFFTTDSNIPWKSFWKKNILAVSLVLLAFAIRTEMLLLVFPLIGLAGIFKWSEEKKIFTKENVYKYLSVLGTMLIGMLLLFTVDKLSYQNAQWQSFQRFFDARTQIYDFYQIPSYEENQSFYESIGVSREEQGLLVNYNFALEDEINDELLLEIQGYAKEKWKEKNPTTLQIKKALWEYRYGEKPNRSIPLFQITMVAYFLLLLVGLSGKKFSYLWKVIALFLVRSGLWMFIIYRNRTPERITHPLYYMEILLLMAMLLQNLKKEKFTRSCVGVAFGMLSLFSLTTAIDGIQKTTETMINCENTNQEYLALQAYTKEHPENLYLFDVMSTVPYNEKAFQNVDNSYSNIGYLGGWISKSPLGYEKIKKHGYETETAGLLESDTIKFLTHSEKDIEWVAQYFESKGMKVKLHLQELLQEEGKDTFAIYQVEYIE